MYTLIQHIEYLMMRYDCVVVPGWGALVAQYSESFYNPSAGVVERPRRSLGFNADVDHNDGLLAQSIVRREGVDYESALRMIAEGVAVYKRQLADGYEVPLGRLGFFHSNEGRAEFIPFYHEMMVDNYFGLRSVSFRPLDEVAEEPEQPKPAPRIFSRRVWKVAASVAALIGLSVLLTTPITVNHNQNLAGLNLPEMKTAAAVHAPVDWSDFEAALPFYKQATTTNPNYAQGFFDVGRCLYLRGQEYIEKHTEMNTKQLAETLVPLYREALPYLEKAKALDSANTKAGQIIDDINYKMEQMGVK